MDQLEGRISIEAALKAQQRKFSIIFLRFGLHTNNIQTILEQAEKQAVPIKYISSQEMTRMAHGKTHGGIIALATAKQPLRADFLLDKLDFQSASLLLLEGIDDAQNFAFTLRSAEALGIDALLLKKHIWDFDGAVLSRASSGAFERMSIAIFEQAEKILSEFKKRGVTILGCIANAQRTIYDVDLKQPVMIAIGGEKRGLSAAVRKQCDTFVKIPMSTDIGSLSLSHSASIVMAEVMRQRLFA